MKDAPTEENGATAQFRYLRVFGRYAGWCAVLILMQQLVAAPLERGQKYPQVVFQKPIAMLIEAPEALLSDPKEPTGKEQRPLPVTARLKRGEHLFHSLIVKAANEHEVDPALIKAIIMAESGYNPKAISKRGAKGLMQLMPKTAESLGVEDIFDPENNINGGVLYFKTLIDLFKGDIRLALAAYNAGIRKVRMYRGIPPFKSTRYYIQQVFKYYEHYRRQMTPAVLKQVRAESPHGVAAFDGTTSASAWTAS